MPSLVLTTNVKLDNVREFVLDFSKVFPECHSLLMLLTLDNLGCCSLERMVCLSSAAQMQVIERV
jgi:hypothetical protein